MPQFIVPQFTGYQAKVVGPFTFRQFVYLAVAGAIFFFLYFSLPSYISLPIGIIMAGGALALAFLKVGGKPLPDEIKNFLMFFATPRIYLWKKGPPPKIIKKAPPKAAEEEVTPKIGGKSQLQQLSSQLETRTK